MDPEILKSFYSQAEVDLAGVRNGILVFLQDRRSSGELDVPIRTLNALKLRAREMGITDIELPISECEEYLEKLLKNESVNAEKGAGTHLTFWRTSKLSC